jgi:hypothetical protein
MIFNKSHINWGSYHNMKRRCYDPKNNRYEYYGAKGIKVCEEWLNSFQKFCEDMGQKPTKKHSIERIDNNANYCKENCKWSNDKEQANNKTNNILIKYNNKEMTLKQLSEISGMNYKLLYSRYILSKTKDGNDLLFKKRTIKKFFLNGERATAIELANILGIGIATFYRKVKANKIKLSGFYVDI